MNRSGRALDWTGKVVFGVIIVALILLNLGIFVTAILRPTKRGVASSHNGFKPKSVAQANQ